MGEIILATNRDKKELSKQFTTLVKDTFEENFFETISWRISLFLSLKSGIKEKELKDKYSSISIGKDNLKFSKNLDSIVSGISEKYLFTNLISITHNRKIDIETELAKFVQMHSRHGFDLLEKEMNENSSIIDFFLNQLEPPTDLDIQKPTTNFLEKLQNGISELNAPLKYIEIKEFSRVQKIYFELQNINYNIFNPDFIQKMEFATGIDNLYLEKSKQAKIISFNFAKEFEPIFIETYEISTNDLILNIGLDDEDNIIKTDLSELPHLLVAGTTGSGKTVFLHSIIYQLLKKDIELYLIDGKSGAEFGKYGEVSINETQDIFPKITEIVENMESRFSQDNLKPIVIIIDEFVDLIMQNEKIEELFIRLAQKGRSAKIHIVLATQRPDGNTINGLLRSNIPARISFKVQKSTESKIILDEVGAEKLNGKGDMLFSNGKVLQRLQGFYN